VRAACGRADVHKVVFYLLLVVLACLAARDLVWPSVSGAVGPTRALWLMFNLFNGVFVTHYFIEAFIWKFSNPYYRGSLGPLYFPRPAFTATSHGGTEITRLPPEGGSHILDS